LGEKKNNMLFNLIAPIYGLFYTRQKSHYTSIIESVKSEMDISAFDTIIDVGCGTGALCVVLKDKGMDVTGLDSAIKILNIAMSKSENREIEFLQANALNGLPFEDKSFDIAIASYVAHGLVEEERKRMYTEMSRITRNYVIIHDYNNVKSPLTSIIEWLEGGDYFHFIKNVKPELKACFSEVKIINVDVRANWYICKPIE